jgi:hypothetical protein
MALGDTFRCMCLDGCPLAPSSAGHVLRKSLQGRPCPPAPSLAPGSPLAGARHLGSGVKPGPGPPERPSPSCPARLCTLSRPGGSGEVEPCGSIARQGRDEPEGRSKRGLGGVGLRCAAGVARQRLDRQLVTWQHNAAAVAAGAGAQKAVGLAAGHGVTDGPQRRLSGQTRG